MNGNPGPNNNNPGNGGNWGYGNPGPNRGKPKSNINLRLLRKKPSNEKINNKDIMEHHAKFHRKLDEHLDKLYFNNATTAVKEFDNLYIEFKNQKEFNNKLDWSKLLDLYFCTHHKNPMGIANADPDLLIKTLKDGSPIELGEKFQEVLGKNYNPGELHTYLLIIKLVSDKSI